MTYAARESSVYGGQPVELYRFTSGLQVWTFTSAEDDQTYNSEVYRAAQVERDGVELSDELARSQLRITLPRDNPVPLLWRAGPPDGLVGLTIFRFHVGEAGDVATIWKGRVAAVEWAGSEASLTGEPVYSSLARPMLRQRYQRQCRHALYDGGCGLDREDWADIATVSSVAGEVVTIATTSRPSGWFTGGYLQRANGQRRMIRAHSGVALTLLSIAQGIQPGEAVTIFAGCDHTHTTCDDKFSNANNFGGFPFVPTKNPFGSGGIL